MSKEAMINLESVSKDYRMGEVTVHALRDLDLAINQGEFIVLLGPSGCGKTTTLNVIGGLDTVSSGNVIVQGENISTYDEKALTAYRRDRVGFVFQFFNLVPTLSAGENIEFSLALDNGGNLRQRSLELLEMVDLRDRADHFPAQLSGGEQQRVAIARALANNPPVLLCDEPSGNLDVDTGQHVLQAIRDMNRREGTTVLLVTHNTAIAPMADRIVRLHNGAVASIDDVADPKEATELTW
jgi:putative ABC transport system ATP-binding protein